MHSRATEANFCHNPTSFVTQLQLWWWAGLGCKQPITMQQGQVAAYRMVNGLFHNWPSSLKASPQSATIKASKLQKYWFQLLKITNDIQTFRTPLLFNIISYYCSINLAYLYNILHQSLNYCITNLLIQITEGWLTTWEHKGYREINQNIKFGRTKQNSSLTKTHVKAWPRAQNMHRKKIKYSRHDKLFKMSKSQNLRSLLINTRQ
jgi:hypothetical protein